MALRWNGGCGSGGTLYPEPGQNVDGAMTQRATTDAINDATLPHWRAKFRDYSLGSQFTAEQAEMIAAGDYKDLINGGYWKVDGKKVRIVDNTNWYKGRGDTEFVANHLVIMCDENVLKSDGSTRYARDTDTTEGGYASMKYRRLYRTQAKSFFTDFFGADHIASYRGNISSAVNAATGIVSNNTWTLCDVEFPSVDMLIGAPHVDKSENIEGSFYGQLMLFRLAPEFIVAKTAQGAREHFLTQGIYSVTGIVALLNTGFCNGVGASTTAGCRPFAFLV